MYSYDYSQITAASDWPRLFLHPRCFCLALIDTVTTSQVLAVVTETSTKNLGLAGS